MTLIVLLLTKKINKEKFLFYANVYSNIKILINILLTCVVVSVLSNKMTYSSIVIKFSAIIYFVTVSTLDSYLIFKRIKKIRQLDISDKEYFLTYIKNTSITSVIVLFIMLFKYIIKDTEDFVFISISMMSIWIYQYIMPYVLKITNKTGATELTAIKDRLLDICPIKGKYKIYSYEGKKSKSANAIVVGTILNRHIFISDYFIENSSQEEIYAILCHECAHIRNHDIEKRIIFLDIVLLLFFFLTCVMDYLRISVPTGAILLCVYVISIIIIYKKMQQNQELRADKFSVSIIGDKKIYIEALESLYRLNDILKKNSKFFSLISTHPQIQERINNLDE